ncbi:MAG: hypothetical protein ACK5N9_06890 [Pirellula sp.]
MFDSRYDKNSLVAVRPGSKRPGFELPLRVEVPGVKKTAGNFQESKRLIQVLRL